MKSWVLLLLLCALSLGTLRTLRGQQGATESQVTVPAVGTVSLPARGWDKRPIYQAASTKRMEERLRAVYGATDWKLDPNKASERVAYYSTLLQNHTLTLEQDTAVRQQLAHEMLNAGDSEGSVRQIEEVRRRWQRAGKTLPPEATKALGQWLALSYLRIGEQENCSAMGGRRACLFPLQRSAVHQRPRGAEGAVRELTALLHGDPQDAQWQWLLNVASMQLGRYPEDVPPRWRVPEESFASEATLPEFAEVAAASGIDVVGHAGGVVVEDVDGDGWLDVVVTSSGPLDQMRLFHNNGDGTFRDATRQSGLIGELGGLNLVQTDYNNDGYPDLLVLRGGWWDDQGCYPLSLLRNNGDGTFDDVTEAAGLLSLHPTNAAAWADFDGDGWLDLFVGHETRKASGEGASHPSQLFHNNHDGTFTEMASASGLGSLGFVKGVAWGDYNRDGRPDLYISTMYGHGHLFRNDGPKVAGDLSRGWRFTDVTEQAGVGKQANSFATWFFDFDNDGWPDLFVAGYSLEEGASVGAFALGRPTRAERPRLYRNMRDGSFKDVSAEVGLDRVILTMGAGFGDLDNDGWLDVYLGTGDSTWQTLLPNRMFRNVEGRRFADVTTSGDFGHLQKGHGIAFADLRRTGFEDVFEEMGGAQPGDIYQSALYRNPGNSNHWVTLKLQGVRTNRPAFGAQIDVTLRTGVGRVRHIFRTVGYGSSFGGNPLEQHIGLGAATQADEIRVTWPSSGIVDHVSAVAADRRYTLREGEGRLKPMETH